MMSSKNKKYFYVSGIVVLLVIISISVVYVCDGNSAPQNKQRPEVVFTHDTHMGEYECLRCHHDYQDGENVLDESDLSEIEPDENINLNQMSDGEPGAIKCVSCHNYEKSKAKTDSQEAFHRQCIGCHEEEAAGPVLCGECHSLSNTISEDE